MQADQLDILLVEPSSTQHRIIHDWLNELGVKHVQWVQSARDALDAMSNHVPDLVISAMHLPDNTGTELVQRMRETDELQEVGFILISSETSIQYLEPLRQAGIIAILPKPFTQHQLSTCLSATVDFIEPGSLEIAHYTADELRILLVDDLGTARKFMRQLLERMGIEQIAEATNGREAQGMIDEQYFDLIITDYNMPEMDGQELLDYIRQQSSQPGVPVLMVTSHADDQRIAAMQQSGVSAVFDKPFNVETLRSVIENVLT